ncbi:hypothetical protein F2Q68_00008482 [Brassica cretica]|uniref:Uncharacterized protein n=1 Tax=Brassica cretica TaxID=69181 RepID=A0A8S9KS17_BRACR|nr:hypothetical protein F2Q68_00008482 [Brassica cretica]
MDVFVLHSSPHSFDRLTSASVEFLPPVEFLSLRPVTFKKGKNVVASSSHEHDEVEDIEESDDTTDETLFSLQISLACAARPAVSGDSDEEDSAADDNTTAGPEAVESSDDDTLDSNGRDRRA